MYFVLHVSEHYYRLTLKDEVVLTAALGIRYRKGNNSDL